MTKNPFINALIALAYIALVASFMFYGGNAFEHTIEGVIVPVTVLSLLVLSAAFMGLTFFYRPVAMYLDGDKQGSLSLLTKTVATFAVITVLLIITIFIASRV